MEAHSIISCKSLGLRLARRRYQPRSVETVKIDSLFFVAWRLGAARGAGAPLSRTARRRLPLGSLFVFAGGRRWKETDCGRFTVSRNTCNVVLASSAVMALVVIVLLATVFPPPGGMGSIVGMLGKWLLLWTVLALLLGLVMEGVYELTRALSGWSSRRQAEPELSRVRRAPQV